MTISVQSVTLERALEIESGSVVSAQLVDGNVLLTTNGGTVFNAGSTSPIDPTTSDIYPAFRVAISAFDTVPYDVVIPEFYSPPIANITLAAPGTMPAGVLWSGDWSPECQYLAISHENYPYLSVYKRTGDVITKLSDPGTVPINYGASLDWSPDGQYLAVSQYTTPFFIVYKRSGDVLTRLSDPAVQPIDSINSISWNPNGIHVAVSNYLNPPYVRIYKRAGDVFTKLPDPSDLPPSGTQSVWSPNGTYLAVTHNTGVMMYKRSGDVLIKILDLPSSSGLSSRKPSWSPDGKYLALATSSGFSGPYFIAYKRSGDEFIKLSDIIDPPTGFVDDLKWSPDGRYLVVVDHSIASGLLSLYRRTNDSLVKIWSIALATPLPQFVTWSPDGSYITVGGYGVSGVPSLIIFKSSMQLPAGPPMPITLSL